MRTIFLTCFSSMALTLGCSGTEGTSGGTDSDAAYIQDAAAATTPDGAADATTADAYAPGDAGLAGDGSTEAGEPDAGPGTADASCVGVSYPVEPHLLDLYLMLDQSGSMSEVVADGGTKWGAVTGAINGFLTQPSAAGLGVGLQYFGLPAVDAGACTANAACTTSADCGAGTCVAGTCFCSTGGAADSCLSSDYQRPSVEIAPLPAVGPTISASMAAHSPATATPTSAALQGAVDHASEWAVAHPGHKAVVLLATDGDPTECDTSLTNIAAIAQKAAAGTPNVLTFVIGIGSSLTNLNTIAAAGGTSSAFIVDTSGNVTQQFLDALDKIRGAAQSCAYALPAPSVGAIDYARVNVQYTPGGTGAPITLSKVIDAASCPPSGDAWYYDVNGAPTQILLCASACTTVRQDAKASVAVVLGCSTGAH
jgi:hypothetical protein